MKKIFILVLLVLIAGCGVQTSEKPEEKEKVVNQVSEEDTTVEDESESNEDNGTENEGTEDEVTTDPAVMYTVHPANWTIKANVQSDVKPLLLTIDDAPDKHGLEMAEKLSELNVPAIFFINGHFIDTDEEKEVLKKIYDLGFEIGNHTMTHSNLSKLSVDKQREEIVTLSEEIKAITGESPSFFRAPLGVNTDFSKKLMGEQNMQYMNWTYGYDWEPEYRTKEAITDIMLNTPLLTDGAILLMHDRDWTNEALVDIVTGLQDKGYTFIDPDQISK